jgi:hypothetical protein
MLTMLPKPFGNRPLHLLHLLELVFVQEDGVRVQPPQHAGDRPAVEGRVERRLLGRLLARHPQHVHEALQLALEFIGVRRRAHLGRCAQRRQKRRRQPESAHFSNRSPARNL